MAWLGYYLLSKNNCKLLFPPTQHQVFDDSVLYKFPHYYFIINCPTAIAYSKRQIMKPVRVCQCICVSVSEHSHGRISLSIFTKIGKDRKTPISKKRVHWGQHRTTSSPILPHKTAIIGR